MTWGTPATPPWLSLVPVVAVGVRAGRDGEGSLRGLRGDLVAGLVVPEAARLVVRSLGGHRIPRGAATRFGEGAHVVATLGVIERARLLVERHRFRIVLRRTLAEVVDDAELEAAARVAVLARALEQGERFRGILREA